MLRASQCIGIGSGYCKGPFKVLVLVLGIVKASLKNWYWYWVLLRLLQKLVLLLGIVKASVEVLGIGFGVKKYVVLLRSALDVTCHPTKA